MQPISRLLMLALISATTLIGCNKEESTTDQTKSTAAVTTNVAAKVKKSIQGTFVNSNMGDTHCSISVVDRNKKIDLSAGMNICSDDSIKVGKNYEFIYEEVEVPDCNECQGNQDCYIKCKKTRKEELITSAKLIGGSDAPRVDQKTVVPKTDAATLQSVSINNRWVGVWQSGSADKLTISETKFGDCQWVVKETAAQNKCFAYYKETITKKRLVEIQSYDLSNLSRWLQQKKITAADYPTMKADSESNKKILDEITDDTFRTIFVDHGVGASTVNVYFLDKAYIYRASFQGDREDAPIHFSITKYRKQIGGSDAPRVDQKTVVPKTDAATLQSVLQGAAELASEPSGAGSTNSWHELKKRYPTVKWKGDAMGDGGVVNFDKGFTLEATGARSMILQTTVRLQTGFPDSNRSLLTTLPSVGKTLLTLCESESMASVQRRYYQINVTGFNPVNVFYEMSSGSGGVWETVTFDRYMKLPKVGQKAGFGNWISKCN